ncbi:hypothetical protein DL98DRAFT_526892 [Cadophora sp. DSE1049]|nr:hypothetical protein DL98DRAFT_526892 [Cadophora sp. DSE1049]
MVGQGLEHYLAGHLSSLGKSSKQLYNSASPYETGRARRKKEAGSHLKMLSTFITSNMRRALDFNLSFIEALDLFSLLLFFPLGNVLVQIFCFGALKGYELVKLDTYSEFLAC